MRVLKFLSVKPEIHSIEEYDETNIFSIGYTEDFNFQGISGLWGAGEQRSRIDFSEMAI